MKESVLMHKSSRTIDAGKMHPRLGKQQYKGEVDLEGFEAFYKECTHPLFYNGDLHTDRKSVV